MFGLLLTLQRGSNGEASQTVKAVSVYHTLYHPNGKALTLPIQGIVFSSC